WLPPGWGRPPDGTLGRCPGSPVRPQELMALEAPGAQHLGADPVGRGRRAHGADDAGDPVAGMEERQQHDIELDAVAGVACAFDGEDGSRALLADRCQDMLDRRPVLAAPALEEILSTQLGAEQLAQPRAGEPELECGLVDPLEHERLREDARDPGRLDVEALRGQPPCTHLVPVAVERLKGSLLHADRLAFPGPPGSAPPNSPGRPSVPKRYGNGHVASGWSTIHATALDRRRPVAMRAPIVAVRVVSAMPPC